VLSILEIGANYLPGLALNRDPPDLCLLSSWITAVSHQCGACAS
jgi:hypothetical protein